MYNTQEIAKRIKNVSKTQNEPLGAMLSKLEMGINTVSELGKGKQISYLNFAKIADHLNVSVDYLLGRTENPNINNNGTSISQKYIGGDANASITNHSEKKTTDSDSDDTISELVAVFKTLDFCDKAKVMSLIAELSTK